ncbi:hypothetical protein SEA_SIXAMA_48 [Gordonia phage Sixama]|uniref:Uncharacterized protein n=1 Tax=Gordonia phage Sixama TaxID=2653271 RepID=A0A5Q2F412_9CAUD|nr:hypothetical protein PP302_gp048 [Gordonia phage Sixama]QGF20227.1 hypothetical protein SEA_SIXAMA_48 [Gordonia phage Sixama]
MSTYRFALEVDEDRRPIATFSAESQFDPSTQAEINKYLVTIKRSTPPENCPKEVEFEVWHDMKLGIFDLIRKSMIRLSYLDSKFSRNQQPNTSLIRDAVFSED